jgi:hypothetical protein
MTTTGGAGAGSFDVSTMVTSTSSVRTGQAGSGQVLVEGFTTGWDFHFFGRFWAVDGGKNS